MAKLNIRRILGRKLFHALWLFVLFGYLALERDYSKDALWLPFGILLAFLALEWLRLDFSVKIPLFQRLVKEKEKGTFLASTYAMIGLTIALAFFDIRVASVAIYMMVFGDLAAGLIGRFFGRLRLWNGKSIEGSLAELVTCLVVGYIVLPNLQVIVAMALAATVIETLCVKIDDNLAIILFSGTVGQLLI